MNREFTELKERTQNNNDLCLNTYSQEHREIITMMFGLDDEDDEPTAWTEVIIATIDENDKHSIISTTKYDGDVSDYELERIVEQLRREYDTNKISVFVTTDYYYSDGEEKFHNTFIL